MTKLKLALLVVQMACLIAQGQDRPLRITLGGNVKPPKLIKHVEPEFPAAAREARMDAARQWVYPPITLERKAVEAVFPVDINFTADDPERDRPDHLFEQGKELTLDDAAQLEQKLATNSKDVAVRAQLLGYYTANRRIDDRRTTLAWFVANDPTSVVLMLDDAYVPSRGNSLADPEGHALLKSLWLNHPAMKSGNPKSDNPMVWLNAEHFLKMEDKSAAAALLTENAQSLPPGIPMVSSEFGQLYAHAIMGVIALDDAGKPVFDPTEAASAFAQKAQSALTTSTDKATLSAALESFQALQKYQPHKWDAIIEQLRKSIAALPAR